MERAGAGHATATLSAAAQHLGMRHQPLAIVVDRCRRVAWVKEDIAASDAAEWRREFERVGG
jgi:hypothetical protein